MQVNPYLHFDGNCEAALKYYQKVLGARIEAMMPYVSGPPDMPTPPDYKKKIMHAKATDRRRSADGLQRAARPFSEAAGLFGVAAGRDPADAERRFKALAEGGTVTMPFGKTFFSKGFGMCTDQFGIPWMVNCPPEM